MNKWKGCMAVPGHPFDARASGCNMLLRDGARLVRSAEDVIEALAPLADALSAETSGATREDATRQPATGSPPRTRPLEDVARLHQAILDRLGPSPMGEDQLIRDLGASSKRVSPALTDLELAGRINRQPGGLISRVT